MATSEVMDLLVKIGITRERHLGAQPGQPD
jgi:hypothetical protein